MAREVRTLTLGAHQFEITQLGAVRGRKVFLQLMKAVGPALEKIDAARETGKDAEAMLASMVSAVFENVSEQMLEDLCGAFSEATRVKVGVAANGQPVLVPMGDNVFDDVFTGDYSTMQGWLSAHVVHNRFLPFLAAPGPTTPAPQPEGDAPTR